MQNSLATKTTTNNTKSSTLNNSKLKTSNETLLSIAHQLAHSIRNEDSDQFFSIYDTLPADWEQSTISSIKETARRLSELSPIEFEADCIKFNCSALNLIEMNAEQSPNEKYKTQVATPQSDGDITRNESFFADKSKLSNPVYNPLLLASTNKFYNVNNNNNSNKNPSKITISNQTLYAENFDNHSGNNNNNKNSSSSASKPFILGGTGLADSAKCRFVTNQLYQQSIDSKHNECVLTSCFDEVVPANQTDEDENDSENSNDSDENDYKNDVIKKESMSSTSSTGSSSSSSSSSSSTNNMSHAITEQQSVIIDMEEDDEEDEDSCQHFKNNNNKEKFESIIQSVEQKKKTKNR